MKWESGIRAALLVAALGTSTSGCLKKMLLNGQIKGTRDGSAAVNTLHDYEIARGAAYAGMAQLEGMHKLAPDNTDALFMLTRGWAGLSFGFSEDDYETAYEKGDEIMSEYHMLRARAGFLRARYYGIELLGHHAEGLTEARRNQETMRAWLTENFTDKEQAEDLLWAGYAWVGHVSASKDVPETVGELFVGVEMVKRSVELDDQIVYGTGYTILGAYHARTAMAELDKAKEMFDKAAAVNGGKYLPTKLNLAQRYYCFKGDKDAYVRTLNEILAAGDDLPEARLQNVIAKRRARRYLGNKIWQEECAFRL
ncbi:MAG: TRAP transporter TatT component family protein [Polyangiaceae bacterium]